MSRQVEGSYFRLSGFSSASKDAAPGTMSMGDWRGPLAIGKLSHHLSGPGNDIIMEKNVINNMLILRYVFFCAFGDGGVLNTRVKKPPNVQNK